MATHFRKFHREVLISALGAGLSTCRFTVGASGAVGTLKQAKSNCIRSITRVQAGTYTVQFNLPFPAVMPYFSAVVQPSAASDPLVELRYVANSYNNETGTCTLRSYVELTDGVVATGTITNVAKANYDDNDTVTISDGFTSLVYEFDFAGDGASGSNVRVNISAATTAESVALILKTAIEANQPLFTVTTNGAGIVTLTQKLVGTVPNVTITETVTDAGFSVTGMASGVAPTGAQVELPTSSEVQMFIMELRAENFDV